MDRLPKKNIATKILAFILAVILWVYVMNEQNPPLETSFQVPLEIRNLGANYTVVDVPDTVRIKVRGTRGMLAGIGMQDIKAYLDLKGIAEGRHAILVHAITPAGLELVEVNPDKVLLRLDTGVSRQLPVEIRPSGTPESGSVVNKIVANLDQVTVEGPKSLVDSVGRVVAIVDLTGKKADFTNEVSVTVLDREGKELEGVSIYPGKINVSCTIAKASLKKVVDIKTVVTGTLPGGIVLKRLTTEPDKIEISGDPKVVNKIDVVYTEPINITNVTKDTIQEIRLRPIEGITASRDSVTVHINVDKQ